MSRSSAQPGTFPCLGLCETAAKSTNSRSPSESLAVLGFSLSVSRHLLQAGETRRVETGTSYHKNSQDQRLLRTTNYKGLHSTESETVNQPAKFSFLYPRFVPQFLQAIKLCPDCISDLCQERTGLTSCSISSLVPLCCPRMATQPPATVPGPVMNPSCLQGWPGCPTVPASGANSCAWVAARGAVGAISTRLCSSLFLPIFPHGYVHSHPLQVTPASAPGCSLVSTVSLGTVPANPSPACMGEPAPSRPLATPATALTGTWVKGKAWGALGQVTSHDGLRT